jgi:hypothetical protein
MIKPGDQTTIVVLDNTMMMCNKYATNAIPFPFSWPGLFQVVDLFPKREKIVLASSVGPVLQLRSY